MKTTPKPHQQAIFDATKTDRNRALFLDPGLGKSKIVIDTAFHLYEQGKLDGVIVASIMSVAENWYVNELPKHAWDNYRARLYYTDSKPTDLNGLFDKKMLNFLCVSKDTLKVGRHNAVINRLVASGRWMLVIDESTWIKNPSTAQSKTALRLAEKCTYRRILSGEPMPNDPVDLLGQYRLVHPEAFGAMTKTRFEGLFCQQRKVYLGNRYINKSVGWSPEGKKLFERMAEPVTTRLTKEEAGLNLPPIVKVRLDVAMSEDQQKVYDTLLETSRAELKEGKVSTDVIIAKLIKLHQITSGFLKTNDGTPVPFAENAKMNVLGELVDSMGTEQLIVWCQFRHDVDAVQRFLSERYKEKAVRIYGGIPQQERLRNLELFGQGRARFLVANPQSIGWGLTLTSASKAIYYSNSYNYEYRRQSEDRIHRIGQTAERVVYYDLCCNGTVDEAITAALERKEGASKQLFRDMAQSYLGVELSQDVTDEVMEEEH